MGKTKVGEEVIPSQLSRILVVAPGKHYDVSVKRHIRTKQDQRAYEKCTFLFYWDYYVVEKPVDLELIFKNASVIVNSENIDCVIGVADVGGIVQAALVATFPHLTGPAFEGSFVCLNKYYTRHLIGSEANANVNYDYADITKFDFEKEDGTINAPNAYPVFVKPAMGTTSCLVSVASDERSLKNYMKLIKEDINVVLQPFRGLIEKFLSLEAYPQALGGIVMLEQYIDIGKMPVTIHTIDGIVAHGKIVPWAISDNIYFKHRPQCFQGVGLPSALEKNIQDDMWKVYIALVENLQKYGFDNEFVDAEVFVFSDGTIKLMEMNGRSFPLMFKLYDEVLNTGDIIEAHLSVSRGIVPESPAQKPGRYGLYAYMATFGSGIVADFINLDKLSDYSDIVTFGHEGDTVVESKGESGFNLGFLSIVDSSYQACLDRMEVIKVDLLKHPELSPWWGN